MAKRPTLADITTGHGTTTKLNANFDAIEVAFDNTLSRDGSSPNAMEAALDMNSNQILNLPDATTDKEPLTYGQYIAGGASAVVNGFRKETQTATSGQTVFTVTSVEWVPGIDNLIVFVNGELQGPGLYTVNSSTQITFTSGLSAADRVDFVVMQIATTQINTTIDAGLVSYNPLNTTNVTNVETKLRESVSVKDFGAIGDGVTDDTAAIQAALDSSGFVYLPKGNYKVTSQLVFSADCSGIFGAGMYGSIITKAFNGNLMLCDTSGAVISDIGIEGSGSTYTGAGIVPRGYNISITRCRINDTEGSCIYLPSAIGSNNLSATYLSVSDCFLLTTDTVNTYAISSLGVDDSIRPTIRVFTRLSGGGSLVDFSGMNRAILSESFGGKIAFSSGSSKIGLVNNRFTNASADITIDGSDHIVSNNIFGFGSGYSLKFAATCANVTYDQSNIHTVNGSVVSPTDLASLGAVGTLNSYSFKLETFTPEWKGSTSDGTLGNSTVNSYFNRDGRMCHYTLSFIKGSTASFPIGTWSWTMPFKALVMATGPLLIKSSSGNWYTAIWRVYGGSNQLYIYIDTGATAVPMTETTLAFGTNAQFDGTISYLIATS